MASLHTPRELELIIKHELGRQSDVPAGLIVQIFRVGDGWRAGSRFKAGRYSLPQDLKHQIADASVAMSIPALFRI